MMLLNFWYYGVVQDGRTIAVYEDLEECRELIEIMKLSHREADYKIVEFRIHGVDNDE